MNEKEMFRIKDAVINCYKILMDNTNGIFLPSDARRTALFGVQIYGLQYAVPPV